MTEMALIVMARYPEKGKVKTRLAVDLGHERALMVYHELLKLNLELVHRWRGPKLVFFTGTPDHDLENRYEQAGAKRFQQQGNDLGQRMAHGFNEAFTRFPQNGSCMIGTDCPDLSFSDLNNAKKKLSRSDVVFGPANDGGYYLVAMNRYLPELLQGIPWSTSEVLPQSLARANQLNLMVSLLNERIDIDDANDLRKSKRFTNYL